MKTIHITDRGSLTFEDLQALHRRHVSITLTPEAKNSVNNAAKFINDLTQTQKPIYGINTGFGKLANVTIPASELTKLQHNLIVSSAAGTGEYLSDAIVRLITAMKISSLARGHSGVRLEIIDALLQLHNCEIYPCIPAKGSVGASGDLAPLAHFTLPLLNIGNCRHNNSIISASQALKLAQLTEFILAPKEGLGLINGTQVSTAIAIAALFTIENVFNAAIIAGSLSLLAAGGSLIPFDAKLQEVRGQIGQIDIAKIYRNLLAPCQFVATKVRIQDPYSLRCQPQVMGACLDHLQFAKTILAREMNSVTDNPIIFSEEQQILIGGNFHAEPVAMAADVLALIIAEIGSMSERRIAMLTDSNMTGLPDFLIPNPGINSGFMLAHVTAASLVNENKTLAHPASIDNIPTSGNQEDHVSMATFAARRLLDMSDNTATIVAIELIAACQGIDFVKPRQLSPALDFAYKTIRKHIPFLQHDSYLAETIEQVKNLVKQGVFHYE